jgi:serine/threonine protein kinase
LCLLGHPFFTSLFLLPPRKINPNLPDPICNVLFKALAKDPNDRYQSAEEMINALEKVQQNLIEETEFTTNEEEEVADLSFESEDEGFENKDEKSEFPQETSSQSVQTSFEEAVDSDKPKKQKKITQTILFALLYVILTTLFLYLFIVLTN